MKPIVREWITKAEEDYRVARREREAKPPTHTAVCFHSQQCVEKYLKAFLQEHEVSFYRTYDLDALMKLCLPLASQLEAYREQLQWLTSFAVEVRYPGSRARKQDAERCFLIAKSLRTLLRGQLGLLRKSRQKDD